MSGRFIPALRDLMARGAEQSNLHERAARVARATFGRRVFVRAVVEVSNFCRENCHYCGMRRDDRALNRYRAHPGELAELLIHHRPASVTDVNIQAGEDPVAVREVAIPLVRALRQHTRLGISVCLGTLQPDRKRQDAIPRPESPAEDPRPRSMKGRPPVALLIPCPAEFF